MLELRNMIEEFERDCNLIIEMTMCEFREYIYHSGKGEPVNLMVPTIIFKYINIVEGFKKISQRIREGTFKSYEDMNNQLLDEDLSTELKNILNNRNYFAHMTSVTKIVNPDFELRNINSTTKEIKNILNNYLKSILLKKITLKSLKCRIRTLMRR